ncbi:MAG: hypothetical protein PF689_01795 [Deltaproteobacteria bacterium]|jgi:hypothetical protein|nr:hypothetical protein [Deltaproteobacteria bacterium]
MSADQKECIEEFKKYLKRFDDEVGEKKFGEYGSWHQNVVKKMNFDEFVTKYEEFKNLEKLYADILKGGDTVNDAIFRSWKEAGAQILLEVN